MPQLGLSRSFYEGRHFPLLAPDDGTGGGGAPADPPENDDDLEDLEGVGASGKDAIKKERAAARAALTARKAAEKERDTLLAEKTQREADDKKRQEDEAKTQGQFEKLAEDRGAELAAAKAENETLKKRLADVEEVVKTIVDEDWKTLPKEVADVYTGEDTDVVAKLKWLPKGKALADRIDGEKRVHGNGPGPKSTGKTDLPSVESIKKEMAEIRGRG